MRPILFIAPKTSFTDGTYLRIEGVLQWFRKNGIKLELMQNFNKKILHKFTYIYLMLSTKDDSLSTKVMENTKDHQVFIVDLYNPIFLEKSLSRSKLENFFYKKKEEKEVKKQLERGNHFIVANKIQIKYWKGIMKKFNVKKNKRQFSSIPTGVPKNINKNIIKNRDTIIWFGGIYPWMNPLPLIKAFAKLIKKYPYTKLRIVGGYNPKTKYLKSYENMVNLAKSEIPSKNFETLEWKNTRNLTKVFEDAIVAVNIPVTSEEDYYSHRIRLLTVLSYGIPIVTSGKDTISDIVIKNKAGLLSKPRVNDLYEAIDKILQGKYFKKMSAKALKVQAVYIKENLVDKNLKFLLKDER